MGRSASKSGMRVAFVSQGLGRIAPPKAEGSIATWTYETARCLRRDHSVLLIEFGEQLWRQTRAAQDGLTYVYVPLALNRVLNAVHRRVSALWRRFLVPEQRVLRPAYASMWHNMGFALHAAWLARRWRCDVIHVHNFSQFVPLVRLLNPSARVVIHMNCEWLSQHEPRMIGRRLRSADVVIGCSAHIIRKVVARFPDLEPRCRVIFNGADVEHFVPAPGSVAMERADPLRILFVGRISPEKGVHLLVDAFVAIATAFPHAHLDLVGGVGSLPSDFLVGLSDDPLVKGLEAFYHRDYLAEITSRIPAHVQSRVTFHGNVDQRELPAYYRRAAIFVNPSLSDAFPLTVVEAMAAGLPIVASAVGGVPEAVGHDVNGLLVEPGSAEAIASALCEILGDANLRRRMSVAARERASRQFSWQAVAESVAAVYATVCRERSPVPHQKGDATLRESPRRG